jgi:hypothetical protein
VVVDDGVAEPCLDEVSRVDGVEMLRGREGLLSAMRERACSVATACCVSGKSFKLDLLAGTDGVETAMPIIILPLECSWTS